MADTADTTTDDRDSEYDDGRLIETADYDPEQDDAIVGDPAMPKANRIAWKLILGGVLAGGTLLHYIVFDQPLEGFGAATVVFVGFLGVSIGGGHLYRRQVGWGSKLSTTTWFGITTPAAVVGAVWAVLAGSPWVGFVGVLVVCWGLAHVQLSATD